MNTVAIVVQRCHTSIVGGSEALAWQYATLLRDAYEVEVLTTTAVDASTWENHLPAGAQVHEGVHIQRFPVSSGRSAYWGMLHERLLRDFAAYNFGRGRGTGGNTEHNNGGARHLPWSMALQEEFIRRQGPYSKSLLEYLRAQWTKYAAIFFVTYLYPTSYFGLLAIPFGCALFVPTLHDEPPAYLSAYKYAARRARRLVWLTNAERRLGEALWGEMPNSVVAAGIDPKLREPAQLVVPYLLYSGRIDPNKGCVQLFDYFIEFKKNNPSKLRLVLTGKDDIPVPRHSDIDFRGFVSDEEKFRLMAGAQVFVMPSGNESFSIATLEAMAQRTPVLASGVSEVIVDHIMQSGAGRIYNSYESFATALTEMLADESQLAEMGMAGREYVVSRYGAERIRSFLVEAVKSAVNDAQRLNAHQ